MEDQNYTISATDFAKALTQQEPIMVVDIRTTFETILFNVGGLLIPFEDLLANTQPIEHLLHQEFFVICGEGIQSSIAVRLLHKKGFEKAKNLAGGLEAYLSL